MCSPPRSWAVRGSPGNGNRRVSAELARHTGEVEVRPDDVVGRAVSIAKGICDLAGPREEFVSEAVKGLVVGSGVALSEQGIHVVKVVAPARNAQRRAADLSPRVRRLCATVFERPASSSRLV